MRAGSSIANTYMLVSKMEILSAAMGEVKTMTMAKTAPLVVLSVAVTMARLVRGPIYKGESRHGLGKFRPDHHSVV
jgi:hypothetical protein